MRFKLDENLPCELAALFRTARHDAVTVLDQGLGGARDPDLASACVREGRAIVTLDTDFSDIRAYPPGAYSGIVVFRLEDQARDHISRNWIAISPSALWCIPRRSALGRRGIENSGSGLTVIPGRANPKIDNFLNRGVAAS